MPALVVNFGKPETSFPLGALLQLYVRAPVDSVYNEYFKGFKAICEALSPIEIPEIPEFPVSRELISYEMDRIASITRAPIHTIFFLLIGIHYGPEAQKSILQQQINSTRMPSKV